MFIINFLKKCLLNKSKIYVNNKKVNIIYNYIQETNNKIKKI